MRKEPDSVEHPAPFGPSRPDPAAKVARRVRRALEPKGPLEPLADLAKKIGRPMDGPKGKRS